MHARPGRQPAPGKLRKVANQEFQRGVRLFATLGPRASRALARQAWNRFAVAHAA